MAFPSLFYLYKILFTVLTNTAEQNNTVAVTFNLNYGIANAS